MFLLPMHHASVHRSEESVSKMCPDPGGCYRLLLQPGEETCQLKNVLAGYRVTPGAPISASASRQVEE